MRLKGMRKMGRKIVKWMQLIVVVTLVLFIVWVDAKDIELDLAELVYHFVRSWLKNDVMIGVFSIMPRWTHFPTISFARLFRRRMCP